MKLRNITLAFVLMGGGINHSLLNAEDIKEVDLGESVVSATGFEQDIKDAPASMSVVTNKDLQGRPIRDLSEAVSQVPGVNIDSGATNFGGYAVSIRGMPTSYTLFLVDGARQDSSSETFPNVSFSQGSFMPPISAIDRIEVIRGPASTIYGTDAIGGVVNVILKKNFDKWVANATLERTIQERKIFSDSLGLSLFTAGPLDSAKNWALQFRVKNSYSFKPTEFIANPNNSTIYGPNTISLIGAGANNQANIGARVSYAPSKANYLYFDVAHFNQWYDPNVFENTFFVRNNSIFRHQGNYGKVRTDTSLQYNNAYNESRNRFANDIFVEHRTSIALWDWNMNLNIGGQYAYNRVNSLKGTVFGGDIGNVIDRHTFSLYIEDEWMVLENLIFTLGGRANMNSTFGFNFSPRGYLVYHILENSGIGDLSLKGGVSTGYKLPTISQVTPGWGSSTCQGRCRVFGNPDLKPESSLNYELTLIHDTDYSSVSLTGFYTSFNDKISTLSGFAAGASLPGGFVCPSFKNTNNGNNQTGTCQYSYNVDTAQSYGLELATAMKPLSIGNVGDIGVNLAYTWNKNKSTSGATKGMPLVNIPEHTLNMALNYSYHNIFGIFLRGELRARQLRTNVLGRTSTTTALDTFFANNPGKSIYYNPYFITHLGGNYNITESLRLNFGIYNLFNHNFVKFYPAKTGNNGASTTYYNDYASIYEGRRYYISVGYDF